MPTWFLYLATVLIWGSTFLVITFQLGTVDPLVSVIYRFALAVLILFIWCKWQRKSLKTPLLHHPFMALQGICLYGLNYWLVYRAEVLTTSGIVAVIFTTIIFFNIFNAWLFLRHSVSRMVVWGALIGAVGVGLIYWPELKKIDQNASLYGLMLCVAAPLVASFGNIAATRNGKFNIPIITTNFWSMSYGTIAMAVLAVWMGKPFIFEWTMEYVGSLLYLGLFGTVIAFGCYLTVLKRIGPERAAYSSLLFPVVALSLSTLFEGYQWTISAVAGVSLIFFGNWIGLRRK
ncbi:DMT family transporter [Porticoccaceae bacterium LTM1]|nr:DMT family transporter [Porticoccaceae bacterium LTM1]